MALSSCFEGCGLCGGGKRDDLAAPAEADDAPGGDGGIFGLNLFQDGWDFGGGCGWCARSLKEVSERFSLLVVVRGVPVLLACALLPADCCSKRTRRYPLACPQTNQA